MQTGDIVSYYSSLLILQYAGKPNAAAHIKTLVSPVVMDQLPLAVKNAFTLGTSIGTQLDILAKYAGVTRSGVGLKGQPITLNDSDFTQLIKLVIIRNNAGSSLATIQSLLARNFPGQVLVSDSRNMTLNYVIIESLGTSQLLELLQAGSYLPKPMGVGTSVSILPVHSNPYFGFQTYESQAAAVAPFNNYHLYQTTYPWLSMSGVA